MYKGRTSGVKGGTIINKEGRVLRNDAFNVGHCGEHKRKNSTVTNPKNYYNDSLIFFG